RRITLASEESQETAGRLANRAHENAAAAQTIRAYGLEDIEAARFQEASDDCVNKDLRRVKLEILFSGSVQLLIAASVFAVLLFGGRQALAGRISTGEFVTFLQYMGMMAWPLTGTA